MKYCGIDAGLKHAVCIKDADGRILHKFKIENCRESYEKVESLIDKNTKICIEDTGVYSFIIYEHFRKNGYDIKRVNSYKAEKLRKFINSNVKTDGKDAEALADLRFIKDDFQSNDVEFSQLKNLTRLCRYLRRQKSDVDKKIQNEILKICPELHGKFKKLVNNATIAVLRNITVSEIRNMPSDAILEITKAKGYLVREESVRKIKECLHGSVGMERFQDTHLFILIDHYLGIQKTVKKLDEEIRHAISESEYHGLIMLRNINTFTAGVLIAEVGDISRFTSHRAFVKYCGLDVTRRQSGKMDMKGLMGKRGNVFIRSTLYTVAMNFILDGNNRFEAHFRRLKEKNKNGFLCMVATMRKIAIWLYYEMKKCDEQFKLNSSL